MSAETQDELRSTVGLAWPLVLAFAGSQLLSVVDTGVAGHLGTRELAAVGIGSAIFFGTTILAIGLLMGLDPLASQALGARRPADARRHFHESVVLGLCLCVPFTVVLYPAQAVILDLMSLDQATMAQVRDYLFARAPSVLPILLHIVMRGYLQAHERARPVMVATLVANGLNVPLSFVLGFGDRALLFVGLPAMGLGEGYGVLGIGLASTIVTVAQAVVLWVALRAIPTPTGDTAPRLDGVRAVVHLGWPIGVAFLVEVGIFVGITLVAGVFGDVAVGAHQVAIQLASLTFTMCLGLSAAASVRVGRAVGGDDTPAARRAAFVAIGLGVSVMATSATIFTLAPEALARLLARPPEVVAAAVPLLQIAAVFQVADGVQAVTSGVLRGVGDTRSPMVINFIGHWVLGAPLGLTLAFVYEMEVIGLWWGATAGLIFSGVALVIRFLYISKTRITPVGAA